MQCFLSRHADKILGVLSGFDRLRFRGTFMSCCFVDGMTSLLNRCNVLLKDYAAFVQDVTQRLRRSTEQVAAAAGLKVEYLNGARVDKEALVDRRIAEQATGRDGVLAVFTAIEGCRTFEIRSDRQAKKLMLKSALRKCLHAYVYFDDPTFGRVGVRLQTWFPFQVNVVLNGRQWLARQMRAAGIDYRQADNTFTWVSDFAGAQKLLTQQTRINWPDALTRLLDRANPQLRKLFPADHVALVEPWWSTDQSEWATDLAFRRPGDLAALYPTLLHRALIANSSPDVMRFLGRKLPAHGGLNGHFNGEVCSDLQRRPEGMRIKHRVNRNSIKMYDKRASVLRVETTINDASDLKAYRRKQGDPNGRKEYRPLRKSVVDIGRRSALCQAANERYLEALAAVDVATPLKTFTERLTQRINDGRRWHRALNPLGADAALLTAVAAPEHAIKGFRNADIRTRLFGADPDTAIERRKRAAKVSRLLSLLRAHGLIRRIPKTLRYQLTAAAKKCLLAILAIRETPVEKLMKVAQAA